MNLSKNLFLVSVRIYEEKTKLEKSTNYINVISARLACGAGICLSLAIEQCFITVMIKTSVSSYSLIHKHY